MQRGASAPFKVAIVFSVMLYVAYAAIPYWPQKRPGGPICSCLANLKQLDGAKEQWAIDNHKPPGSRLTYSDLVGASLYIKAVPKCPYGGTYDLNQVGEKPTCTYPGYLLPNP